MIQIHELSMRAGDFEVQQVSFSVARGQYAVLMGRTGCGKTSVLEAICGLRRVASGNICIAGVDITHWSPADRGVGYVPQDLALFPTLTVREHLQFALRVRAWSRAAIGERTEELASVLNIGHLLNRRVQGLSGGEAQRTALGRALSFKPSVLLLDEPLSALDEGTRHEMYQLLRTVKQATGVTTLHVTHSREEADSLGDLHLTMEGGRLTSSHSVQPDADDSLGMG